MAKVATLVATMVVVVTDLGTATITLGTARLALVGTTAADRVGMVTATPLRISWVLLRKWSQSV